MPEMEKKQLNSCRNFFTIDWKMLPMKLHFFLYALAISAVLSYFAIMAKNIGITTTAVGIMFTVCPFTTVLTNPIFGWVTDKLQKLNLVMIAMIIIQTPLFIGTVFVPPIETETKLISVELICSSESSYAVMFPNISSLAPNNTSLKCRSSCFECHHRIANTSDNAIMCGEDAKFEAGGAFNSSWDFLKVTNISLQGKQQSPNCGESVNCETLCDFVDRNASNKNNQYTSYQYWTLLFLVVSSVVMGNACIAIGDAACYEALEGRVNQFGKQRVWLSIGWGIGTMLTGYLLDLTATGENGKVDFKYCAYVMVILIVFDVITLSQAKLKKPKASKQIFKDICKVFKKPHPFFFVAATIFIGSFLSVQWTYQFWYLDQMGATKLLLGLSTAVLCVLVESPFMFLSGWIVKRIGRDNSMILSLLALALWFVAISFIHNPWWILLIDLSQGPSYGLFYVAISSYGKIVSAPGTEATMQTFLGAAYHGLGVGSGSLLGGLAYELYGGRNTFRFCGFLAIGVAIIYKLLTFFVAGEHTVTQKDVEMKEDKTIQEKSVEV